MCRRRGFTLIELLVVIAIIGILAAMLFPVFARARESARKIQCLSNVKNLALAVQMYLTDYDRFPPSEHRAEVADVLGCDSYATPANPYLRWPVIMDEYVKNRDVYKCPSAKNPFKVMWVYPGLKDWLLEYQDGFICACQSTFPSGWGGAVTDSRAINSECPINAEGDPGSVEFGIQYSEHESRDKSTSEIGDAAKYIVVGERGIQGDWNTVEQIAYPDLCRVSWMRKACSTCGECEEGEKDAVGTCTIGKSQVDKWWSDSSWRNQWTRHMGGNNIGFADGHAKWWAADAMIAGAGNWHDPHPSLEGIPCFCLPDNPSCSWWS